jgi:D-sedoheptulose 7-phosphate isomerase
MLVSVDIKTEKAFFTNYAERLTATLVQADWRLVAQLAEAMLQCWQLGRQVFICGNGGSAGNAIHLANDFLYGIAKQSGRGLKATALSANSAIITCLANDVGYHAIYSEQLAVLGSEGDLLITLSGSGNSPNILEVLKKANEKKIMSCAILGYTGGEAKELADIVLHFPVHDMQIAEDIQLIVGHMLMQYLYRHKDEV